MDGMGADHHQNRRATGIKELPSRAFHERHAVHRE
jgi:hypothetical protein